MCLVSAKGNDSKSLPNEDDDWHEREWLCAMARDLRREMLGESDEPAESERWSQWRA